MYRIVKLVALGAVIAAMSTAASAQNRAFEAPPSRSSQGVPGAALTLPSTASPRAVLAQYLRAQGRSQATVDSLAETSRAAGRQGITHVQFEQRAAGLPVYGTSARAAFSARGELLNVVDNLVAVPARVARADVNAQQAIAAAVAYLYPALRTIPVGFFREDPSAARVAIPLSDGSLAAGFLVETWTARTNQLHETLVDGSGQVVNDESRTNKDSYRVFRINPDLTPQQVVAGVPAGDPQSPTGWLFSGTQGTTQISGNNVSSYLDVVSDNRSDALGGAVTSGDFLTVADLTVSPSVQSNREVAVQNLFFLNNVIHDELYRQGFNEAALNFQVNNFGKGGRGNDPVNAEAQDGGGTDNANFATPRDGRSPRMQMYLWTGAGPTHEVLAGGQTFGAKGAEFGPALNTTGVSAVIRVVNDGTATTTDACEALPAGSMNGAIALIDRGTCNFTVKVKNAQNAGAVAAIVANNTGGETIMAMGGTDSTINIPSVFVSQNSGATLKAMGAVSGVVRLKDVQPLQRDGDIDSDVVFHEYCHGLTWRMIGGMDGPLAGAIGEGMSDVCAIMMNGVAANGTLNPGADVIGEYAFGDPAGIRRQPYAGYNLITYGDIQGTEVHNDGELYAAIGWRMLELFGTARKDDLFGYMVDGMNYTPSTPTYEMMRDGILQSVANTPGADAGDSCRVWDAFAHFGVGVGAKASVRRNALTITESFAVPAGCPAP